MPAADDWLKQPVYRALLDDVVANPDDDTPRLVVADWLEEHAGAAGEARAAFLRAQMERAKLSPHERRAWELRVQEAPLLEAHQGEWLGRLARFCSRVEWRRGFVERVALGVAAMARNAADLFALTPVYDLQVMRLSQSKVTADDLSRIDALKRTRSLCLRNSNLGDERVSTLLQAVGFPNLEALDLSEAGIGAGTMETLAELRLPRLRSLLLGGNVFGGNLVGLLDSLTGCDLEEIGLASTVLPHGLADWKGLDRMKRLDLSGLEAGAADWQRLLGSPRLGRLEGLRATLSRLGAGAVSALCRSGLGSLRKLEVGHCAIGRSGLEALAEAAFPALESLDLAGNEIDAARTAVLARWPGLARLRSLSLRNNLIGDAGLEAFLASPHLGPLVSLDLSFTDITPRGLARLADHPRLSSLASLDLSANRGMDDAAVASLLEKPAMAGLLRLGTDYLRLSQKFRAKIKRRCPL